MLSFEDTILIEKVFGMQKQIARRLLTNIMIFC